MVTRSDDYEWSLLVEVVHQGLLEAEGRNITQATATDFPPTPAYTAKLEGHNQDIVSRAIESVGNFGRLFERELGITRAGLNSLRRLQDCRVKGGLLYAYPFGTSLEFDTLLLGGGRIGKMRDEKKVRCGVPTGAIPNNDGAGESISRFHIEQCKTISAALFDGSVDNFEVVNFTIASSTGSFELLRNDQVDVLLGVTASSLPTLGEGLNDYAVTPPHLFYPLLAEPEEQDAPVEAEKSSHDTRGHYEAFLAATISGDHKWSVILEWILNVPVLAEEMSVSMVRGEIPPEVLLFGSSYAKMFRNIVSSVGNYGEIYARSITEDRSGCNQLNVAPHTPQQHTFLFHGL